jgi:alpha-L-rhamnosidase
VAELPPSRPWHARWIWSEVPQPRRGGADLFDGRVARPAAWCCLRRTFELAAIPPRASARMTADSRYVLWVNGSEVARGPVRGNPRRLHFDEVDLAPHLRRGRNAIAALVRYFGSANPIWMPAPAGFQLGAGAFLFEAELGGETIASDARWKARGGAGFAELPGRGVAGLPIELCDAREHAPDWREADFDDGDWAAAATLAANAVGFDGRHEPPSQPYGPLLPRPMALLSAAAPRDAARLSVAARAERGAAPADDPVDQAVADLAAAGALGEARLPLALAPGDGASVVCVDFGEVVAGTVVLELDAPAGTRVDASASEFADAEGKPRFDGERGGFRYVARGVADRFETFGVHGLRHLALAVRGPGPATLKRVAVVERSAPRPAGAAFECSDPLLNRIFAVGRRTVDLCSHDAYVDCPTREQRGWTGDFVVHQMVDFATNPDWSLARWNVEMTASPRPDGMLPMAAGGDVEYGDSAFIPDWALHWVRALWNLWRYTGDREAIARLLPVAERVLRWFEPFRDASGLATDVTGWVIIDWASVSTRGQCAALNALWARGLRDFAELAEWMGDAGRAAWARARHAEVSRAFERFWDEKRGVYVDHALAGAPQRPASQHAQAAALAAGLVPETRVARVADAMMDRARQVDAVWWIAKGDAHHPGPGEERVGGPYLALGPPAPWWDVERQLVRAQPFFRYVVHDALAKAGRADRIAAACRDWAELFARSDTSWSETWTAGTVSHGWCSTPTRDLVVRTLGITPAEPGFTTARVAPRLGDLAWARGTVPTPFGPLSVEARGGDVSVDSPVPFVLDRGDGAPTQHPAGRLSRV